MFSLSAVAIPGHISPPIPWPRTDIVSRFVARDAFATQVNQVFQNLLWGAESVGILTLAGLLTTCDQVKFTFFVDFN